MMKKHPPLFVSLPVQLSRLGSTGILTTNSTSASKVRPTPRCCVGVALVRPVPTSISSAILAPNVSPQDISLERARKQHRDYMNVLQALILTYMIPPAHEYPDSVFIEDTGIAYKGRVLLPRAGVESREGESVGVEKILKMYNIDVERVDEKIEGGDVLITPNHVFVGKSKRLGAGGKEALEGFFDKEVHEIDIGDALHLKSLVTWVDKWEGTGGGFLIGANDEIVKEIDNATGGTEEYIKDALIVDKGEEYAANTLSEGGHTIMASGFPKAMEKMKARGVQVLEVDVSEFKKAQGSLTCLSLVVRD